MRSCQDFGKQWNAFRANCGEEKGFEWKARKTCEVFGGRKRKVANGTRGCERWEWRERAERRRTDEFKKRSKDNYSSAGGRKGGKERAWKKQQRFRRTWKRMRFFERDACEFGKRKWFYLCETWRCYEETRRNAKRIERNEGRERPKKNWRKTGSFGERKCWVSF